MKGAVSTGHPLTTEAAITILKKGGTAFDAITAAAFVACAAEPVFASLGGGGFLLGHHYGNNYDFVYDFFVDTPGKGLGYLPEPDLVPFELQFSGTTQFFYGGMASIAVPGMLKGLLDFHKKWCSMDIDDLISPAIEYLYQGIELTQNQRYIIDIVTPILHQTKYGRKIFSFKKNNRLYNPLFKEFLELKSPRQWLDTMYYGKGALPNIAKFREGGGRVTVRDLHEYQVFEREPIKTQYGAYEFISNPLPSFGGNILCRSLEALDHARQHEISSEERYLLRAYLLRRINSLKGAGGTTHLNVIDADNNAASLSLSTGTSSGYFLPGTGILMNNMMGEKDLHPDHFYCGKVGERVPSMMSPSFLKKGRHIHCALGSGGSNRIPSAILQVVLNHIDDGLDIQSAIEAPRMHFDEHDQLQIEPGMSKNAEAMLTDLYENHNVWKERDMYFGGVHAVMGDLSGWGDSRRNGVYKPFLKSSEAST